jgi:hypothetical protein
MSVDLKNKIVKCRKKHQCEWCDEPIIAGEKARYRVYIHYGEFKAAHQHLECYSAMCSSDEYFEEFMPGDQLRGKTYEDSHA